MKWIAVHQNEVVGEFKNEADAKRYKEAADRAAFDVVLVEVDDADYGCYIKMTGLYGMLNHYAYYRKNGDCFDFCSTISYATVFPGGQDNEEVKEILASAEWYTKQYSADKLIAVPCYQFKQKDKDRDLLDSVPLCFQED